MPLHVGHDKQSTNVTVGETISGLNFVIACVPVRWVGAQANPSFLSIETAINGVRVRVTGASFK